MHTAVLRCQELSLICGFLLLHVCVYEMPQCNDDRSERNPSVCSSSRRKGFKQPRTHANSLTTKLAELNSNNPLWADVPSCAIAAVLVVAAGLVCCRPTIGQRGIQCGGTGGAGATLKPDSFMVLWIVSLMNFKASDKSYKTQVPESVWYYLDEVKRQTGRLLSTTVPVPQNY